MVPLDRSPVLLSTAMPVELVCKYDEDDNGLDDEIETQIAQAFVPQFRFDAAEEHTRPGEPHAVFNAKVSLADDGSRLITVRYVRSRRLRSGHDETARMLRSPYKYFDPHLYGCPAFSLKYMVHVRWPEEFIRWPEGELRAPVDVLLAANGPAWNETYLVRGDARQAVSVGLTEDLSGTWVAASQGVTAPMTNASSTVAVAKALTEERGMELATMPSLMRLETDTEQAKWAVLRPAGFDGETVTYALQQSGELPFGVGPQARLIHDQLGTFVALVSPEQAAVYGRIRTEIRDVDTRRRA